MAGILGLSIDRRVSAVMACLALPCRSGMAHRSRPERRVILMAIVTLAARRNMPGRFARSSRPIVAIGTGSNG